MYAYIHACERCISARARWLFGPAVSSNESSARIHMEVLKQGAAEPLPAEVILAGFFIAGLVICRYENFRLGASSIATKLEVLNPVDQDLRFLRHFFDFSISWNFGLLVKVWLSLRLSNSPVYDGLS